MLVGRVLLSTLPSVCTTSVGILSAHKGLGSTYELQSVSHDTGDIPQDTGTSLRVLEGMSAPSLGMAAVYSRGATSVASDVHAKAHVLVQSTEPAFGIDNAAAVVVDCKKVLFKALHVGVALSIP